MDTNENDNDTNNNGDNNGDDNDDDNKDVLIFLTSWISDQDCPKKRGVKDDGSNAINGLAFTARTAVIVNNRQ